LLAGLLLGAATVAPFTPEHGMAPTLPQTGWLWDHPLLLVINGLMLQTLLPGTMMTGIGPAWTLTVELCFYLALPVLAWAAFAGGRRWGIAQLRAAWLGPALLVAVGLVAKWVHVHVVLAGLTPVEAFFADWGPTWQAVFARSVLLQADVLGIGMGAAVVYVGWRRSSCTPVRLAALGITGVAGLTVAQLLPTWSETGWALFWAAVVLLVATRQPGPGLGRLAAFLNWRPVRWAGEVSYSVYLWHLPVILLLAGLGWTQGPTRNGFVVNCVLVVVLTYLLAHLTWRFVEKPALRRRAPVSARGTRRTWRPARRTGRPA
jgi:peptidoglycan/LPS O-acetylase OafA/YrhL